MALPASWGPFGGETLALIESKFVEPRTYGMSDADFIAWVQKAQTFDVTGSPGKTQQVIPAEWNYYGDMSSSVLAASVVGVQTAPGKVYTSADPSVPLSAMIGSSLTHDGGICDVNSQGSPPATQFFIEQLTLMNGGATAIQGRPSKGACQWINFYRNVNLGGDGGAGGYVYHVILKNEPGTVIDIPEFQDPKIRGVIFRYYLFRTLQGVGGTALEEKYKNGETNPATLEFVATFAPLYDDEQFITGPTGRLLIADATTIPTPTGTNNNENGLIALAPAVLQWKGNIVSADFCGTFPDYYQKPANPKYDFGPVTLMVDGAGTSATIAPVAYADTAGGDARGWVLDFDLSSNEPAQKALKNPNATFRLSHRDWGNVLGETDYYFVSNQQAIYAEQGGPGDEFLNQGTAEPATVAVYSRGQALAAGNCPPITVWQYRSIPLQSLGNAEILRSSFQPGDRITVDTSQPGNYLLTFTARGPNDPPPAGFPPKSYAAFMNPPYVTNRPSMSLRILPNNEDFSRYYVDPKAEEPLGNDELTFDVVYRNVLRTYYLLYRP